MALDFNILLSIIATIVFILFMETVVTISIILYMKMRNNKNNIDIPIIELNKNGVMGLRIEKGRREYVDGRGWKLVSTTRFGINAIKDDLGVISDEKYFYPSLQGVGRKSCMMCIKDGIPTPLEALIKSNDLSDTEKEVLKKLKERLNIPVEFPTTVSMDLNPLTYQSQRYKIDMIKDAQSIFDRKREAFVKTLIWAAVIVFIVLIVAAILIFWITTHQSGVVASKIMEHNVVYMTNTTALPPG